MRRPHDERIDAMEDDFEKEATTEFEMEAGEALEINLISKEEYDTVMAGKPLGDPESE